MRFEISEVMKQNEVMDLVFGNCDVPKNLLGRHFVKNGQVISAYHPDAVRMRVVDEAGDSYEMDRIERQPVFALYLPSQISFSYQIEMTFKDGNTYTSYDPYSFSGQITEKEEEKFLKGCWLDSYKKMGCHPMRVGGVDGIYFAVWAPAARRVSVIGDFNFWNGMTYPMHRLEKSGIFELFIPGVTEGHYYKFEIKTMQGEVYRKSDPYGVVKEDGSGDASKILNMNNFQWDDAVWMKNRRYREMKDYPLAICHLTPDETEKKDDFFVDDFTYVLFDNHGEQEGKPAEDSDTRSSYMPAFCHGSPDKWRDLICSYHQKGLGVLMEVSLGYFSKGTSGLERFDGNTLYGYTDDRFQIDEKRNRYRFCYEKPEVVNYLLSSLLFWMREYHIDGFIFEGITDILSVGKDLYHETNMNVALSCSTPNQIRTDMINHVKADAISPEVNELHAASAEERFQEANADFLRKALDVIRKEDSSVIVIADEKAELFCKERNLFAVKEGFDFFWNYSVKENLNNYFEREQEYRKEEHFRITLPLQKAGLEGSVLLLNQREPYFLRNSQIDKKAEVDYDKLSEVKLSYAYLMGVPGKKVCSDCFENIYIKKYLSSLLHIYREHPALYEGNPGEISFEWINALDAVSSVVSFVRKSSSGRDQLLFVCNFGEKFIESYQIGVPKYGKYQLISNSDSETFGGKGLGEKQSLIAVQERCDFKPYSIEVTLPPKAVLIFELLPAF